MRKRAFGSYPSRAEKLMDGPLIERNRYFTASYRMPPARGRSSLALLLFRHLDKDAPQNIGINLDDGVSAVSKGADDYVCEIE